MQFWHVFCAWVFWLSWSMSLGARILHFVPTLSYSHVAFNGKLADLLVQKGHNVTVMLIDVDPSVTSTAIEDAEIRRIDANMSSGILPLTLWKNPGPFEDASPLNPKIVRKLIRVASIFVQTCRNVMTDRALITEMASREYDIGIVEQYDMCGVGFLKLIKVQSIVWLSATANYRMQPETIGINYPLSYVPELFSPFSQKMSLLERSLNSGIAVVTEFLHKTLSIAEENRIFKRLNRRTKYNLFDEARDSGCIVTNMQPFLDFPAPTGYDIVNIGGITVPTKRVSQLNKEWDWIARRGPFIIVTFGSIAKTIDMPEIMRNSLFRSFNVLQEFNFIVKYENLSTEVVQNTNNVFLARWLPQIDLICHPNYKGIVTHGGWSTVLESLSYGKPMLLMPLFADHFKNAKVVESLHLGLIVDKMNILENTFTNAITELVTNQRYVKRSKTFAEMLRHPGPAELRDVVTHRISKTLKPSFRFIKDNFRLNASSWPLQNKKFLLFPNFSLHYKQPVLESNEFIQQPLSNSDVMDRDQTKRQTGLESDDVVKPEIPALKQTKSIRHQCYFSPIQCLLTLPEDKMRTIVKTHNGVNMESRTVRPVVRSTSRTSNIRFRQHEDDRRRFGNGLFHFSPLEQY